MESIAVQHRRCSLLLRAFEVIALMLTAALFVLKVAICLVTWWGNPSLLLIDLSLPEALDREPYKLTIAPPQWIHLLWPVLFFWEAVWILFAWSFLCRKRKHRTIFVGVHPAYWFACLVNIAWAVSWGKDFPVLGLAFGALLSLTLILCVGMVSVKIYFISGDLKYSINGTLWATRILVLNVFAAYAAWAAVLTLFNLGSVLQHSAQLHPDTTSTVVLSLLGSLTVAYFLLESTILDWFLRSVFIVYLVVGWSLAGVVVDNWAGSGHRNELLSLVLACVCGALFVIRILLIAVFKYMRPLGEYESEEDEKLPF